MHNNNASHINYGFHYGEGAPGHTPGYPAPGHTPEYPAPGHTPGYPAPGHTPGYPAPGHTPEYPAPGHTPEYPAPCYPNVPLYSNVMLPTIDTHYSATSGLPHTTATHKEVSKTRCLCITAGVIVIIIVLAITAVLIWYFLYGVCVLGQRCGQSSGCVQMSQWCDGQTDCPAGEDEAQCFRLYGPNSMLQSFSNEDQKWKVVCSYRWDNSIGKQVCEQIGYSKLDYVSYGTITPGSSAADGYMTLKSVYSNPLGSDSVHSALSSSASCPTNTAVTLKCIACGSTVSTGTRIIGGQVVSTRGRWPWQVSLKSGGSHRCGGSIITPSWILTAAHCVYSRSSPNQWTVYAGYLTLNEMTFVAGNTVQVIVSHPGYDPETHNNDVTLMKLLNPLQKSSYIGAVCLPNTGLYFSTSKTYYVTGWGSTVFQGPASNELREAQVSLISQTVCNSKTVYNGQITDSMICAGKLEGGVDSCQGDSGGPLVTLDNSLWWLVGDTSWGQACALRNRPGVYGNVTYFLDWIYMQMKKY